MYRASGSLWLPSGQSKRIRIGDLAFFARDGLIWWEDRFTGKAGSMLPIRAIPTIRDMANKLLGTSLQTSICKDRQDYNNLKNALQALEQLAKDTLPSQPELPEILPASASKT